ncbi:oxidoreductase, partial [Streptomyces sp. NPDC002586]
MTENLHTVVVTDRRQEADGVVSLTLRGSGLPPWTPGAHLDLLLADGLERQYSIYGDPAERDLWRIAVLREPEGRGGSAFVHERLQ